MDFLGVGPMELFFVIIIALIIMGPKDMQKTGRTLGRWLNTLVRSDTWKMVKQASNKIKYLPNELMREAGIEELKKIGKDMSGSLNNTITKEFDDPFNSWKQQSPIQKQNLTSSGSPLTPTSDNLIDQRPSDGDKDNHGKIS